MKDTILKTESFLRKEFALEKNGIRLNFTLRVDIKQELKDFKDLLELAQTQVKEELEKLSNKV